jgi:flagellar motor switch protein FliN/FliY
MDPSMMQGQPMMGMPQMGMPQMGMPMMAPQMMNMNIQPAQFQNFAGPTTIWQVEKT